MRKATGPRGECVETTGRSTRSPRHWHTLCLRRMKYLMLLAQLDTSQSLTCDKGSIR